jgi:hypothetical protein
MRDAGSQGHWSSRPRIITGAAAPGLDDHLGRRRLDSPDLHPAKLVLQCEFDRVPAEVRFSDSLHAARREASPRDRAGSAGKVGELGHDGVRDDLDLFAYARDRQYLVDELS